MEKIKWCLKQKKGIRLVDVNLDLVQSYIKKAEESLEMVGLVKNNWKVICSYYACYDIFYALLQRCGIKSEIHDCTIILISIFDDFTKKDFYFLSNLKKNRIKVQYYASKEVILIDINIVKNFVFKVKKSIYGMNDEKVSQVLNKLDSF